MNQRHHLAAVVALGIGGIAGTAVAQDQQFPTASTSSGFLSGPVVKPTEQARPTLAPPPALPGAQPTGVVPQDKSTADMQPTDALFDAINRGDIGAARDAVARGADLEGRSVLGLTPLEASVDLRRNDISFFLLSLRGSGRRPGGPATAAATAAVPARAKAVKPTRQPALPVAASAPAPQLARQFAGDGGAPIPDAGFLGFDQGRVAAR